MNRNESVDSKRKSFLGLPEQNRIRIKAVKADLLKQAEQNQDGSGVCGIIM